MSESQSLDCRALVVNTRGLAVFLFVGSNAAGNRAGVLMSLVASCKVNHVEPYAYIKDVLTCLAHKPATDELLQLLPNQWLQSHPEHRWLIADRRKADRQRKQS